VQSMADEMTEFEAKLLKWLVKSEFHLQPWSTKAAAKAFKVPEAEVYEAVAALTKKVPERIQIFYKDGSVHIAAD
jgi:TorA maturation chaperone TorD